MTSRAGIIRRGLRAVAVVVLASAGAACGLSITGVGTEPTGVDGAVPTADGAVPGEDAAVPSEDATTPPTSVVCDAGAVSNLIVIPANGAACPSGMTNKDVQSEPVAGSGACGCGGCTSTKAPSCTSSLTIMTGTSSNACTTVGTTYSVTDGACNDIGQTITLSADIEWTADTPKAGTCTVKTNAADPSKVTTTALHECTPKSASDACDAVTAGATPCIASADGTCSGAFSKALVVGDAPMLDCGTCTCTNTSPTCTVGYYDNASCNNTAKFSTPANGVCNPSNSASGVSHFSVTAAQAVCTATPGAPTAGLTNPHTLCCVP